ncbi:N-acetylmuramoyl-L-alanine amidase family protein [Sporolituus thermophilus]|uniref:N-acetylmuramoyl-L-alanine amidase n=1 Tax=Sporolituus thermophilus DSM 23256 TaxID=1123285 RepID=A0A1G7KKF0_9FIRM|nr:N-acetylmuramoyl-L-alanine amidase [Sporolituus thermophilus]SDF37279.1 N-acetylmuramoyl-L-alanine amidase [Sporolituus thermophilus DSM 23256]
MQIIIDGHKVPVNPRVSKDLLITLKSIARSLHWGILYDTNREIVYINTKSTSVPAPPHERPAPSPAETESNRLAGKTICIDPGHGGSDPGAIGPTGTMEKDNTLAIALLLCDKLEKNGATVIMTRETDRDVSTPDASVEVELGARVDIANGADADIFISIHNDSFTNPTAAGTTTFHYGHPESIRLANCIQKSLVEGLGTRDRGVRFASFFVIRYTKMPAVLVEVAFITNPEEEVVLASIDGRCKAAESIFQGIVKYFKV